MPFTPWRTYVAIPLVSLVTIGRPNAEASLNTTPAHSARVGRIRKLEVRRNSESSRLPCGVRLLTYPSSLTKGGFSPGTLHPATINSVSRPRSVAELFPGRSILLYVSNRRQEKAIRSNLGCALQLLIQVQNDRVGCRDLDRRELQPACFCQLRNSHSPRSLPNPKRTRHALHSRRLVAHALST